MPHEMKPTTTTARNGLVDQDPSAAVTGAEIGSATVPFTASPRSGWESIRPAMTMRSMTPTIASDQMVARGTRSLGFWVSSATAPHASKPNSTHPPNARAAKTAGPWTCPG